MLFTCSQWLSFTCYLSQHGPWTKYTCVVFSVEIIARCYPSQHGFWKKPPLLPNGFTQLPIPLVPHTGHSSKPSPRKNLPQLLYPWHTHTGHPMPYIIQRVIHTTKENKLRLVLAYCT